MKAATVLSAYGSTMGTTSNIGIAVGVATSLLHPPSALVQPQASVSVSSVSAQPRFPVAAMASKGGDHRRVPKNSHPPGGNCQKTSQLFRG